jgi:hypothetical protein
VQLGPVVINGVDAAALLEVPDDADPVLAAAARFRNERRRLHQRELARLADELALEQIHLPHIASAALGPADIERLAASL